MQKLLELDALHHPSRPLLTPEGCLRLKGGKIGPTWSDVVARAANFISQKFRSVRSRDEYGRAVHSLFVKITAQMNGDQHLRSDAWIPLFDR